MDKNTAASLSIDILVSIFKFLDTSSKGKAAQVCSSWNKILNSKIIWKCDETEIHSENLNIQTKHSIMKRGIKRFNVHIFKPRINEFLRRVPDLEHLRFIECPQRPNPTTFRSYKITTMHNHVLTTLIKGMKNLKVLHLDAFVIRDSSYVSDIDTELFAGEQKMNGDRLPLLHELSITNFLHIKSETIKYISEEFVNLVSLDFGNCRTLTSLGHLPKLKKLEFLRIRKAFRIVDDHLKDISLLQNLKSLDLGFAVGITDIGLKYIYHLKNLTCLKICPLSATSQGFRYLNELPSLRELGLRCSWISDAGLFCLAEGNLKLTKLDLTSCEKITDTGLLNICRSTFLLRELIISNCKVTDYGVSRIVDTFPQLLVLDLTRCSLISDESKQSFAEILYRKYNFNPNNTEKA